jgi:ABC-2 type transport system permease protein
LESLVFVIASLALGVFISTAANTQLIAMMISLVGLLLPTIILSGFIFPVKDLPEILQWLSHAVPAKWFLIVVRGIMLKGQGLAKLWMETIVLSGMCVFFLALSTLKFKSRLA